MTQTNTIFIQYGEIALKGKNQSYFLRRLKQNLEQKLQSVGADWPVHQLYDHFYVEVPRPEDTNRLNQVLTALGNVAGIAWYAPARQLPAETIRLISDRPDYKLIETAVTELAREHYAAGKTFCVRTKRGEKRFPRTSPEVEAWLGAAIREKTGWNQVNLKHPDQTFYVNVQPEGIYLYQTRHPGMRGLPVGVSGRVLTLLSGGIDSPVAAYLAARRGCSVDFIHFTATPIRPDQAQDYKVSQMARDLSKFTMYSRLYLVPYTHFEFAIIGNRVEYELIIFRRFMTRVAEQLAGQLGAQALVTGDNLGQVASQTLENIVSNSQAVKLPILRPLLTYDKQEIIDLARDIGTYRLSLKPYKDCCSILQQHPKTKSDHRFLSEREETILPDYQSLIGRTLEDAVRLKYACGERVR